MRSFKSVKVLCCCLLSIFFALVMNGCSGKSARLLSINGDGTFTDVKQNLVWQQEKSVVFMSPEEAVDYVENLKLAGSGGWRLPTLAEFHNLYFAFDYGKRNQRKKNYQLYGNFWVKDKDGRVVVGSWNDKGGGCCIIREFKPFKKGYVKAVKVVDGR